MAITVWVLLTTLTAAQGIHWNQCQFSGLTLYDESCEEGTGAKNLETCLPGHYKLKECNGVENELARICDPCPAESFQNFFNNCTECHPCSTCPRGFQLKEACTSTRDVTCEPIPETTTITTTQDKTTVKTLERIQAPIQSDVRDDKDEVGGASIIRTTDASLSIDDTGTVGELGRDTPNEADCFCPSHPHQEPEIKKPEDMTPAEDLRLILKVVATISVIEFGIIVALGVRDRRRKHNLSKKGQPV